MISCLVGLRQLAKLSYVVSAAAAALGGAELKS